MNRITEILGRLGSDPRARGEVVEASAERMLLLARRMLRKNPRLARWEASDDLAQGAAVKLMAALQEARPADEAALVALCGEMIRRELLDRWRKHFGRQGRGGVSAKYRTPPPGADRVVPEVESEDPGGQVSLEAQELIASLPDEQRRVVELRFLLGLSVEEVARRMGVSTKTVVRHSARAAEAIASAYGGDDGHGTTGAHGTHGATGAHGTHGTNVGSAGSVGREWSGGSGGAS